MSQYEAIKSECEHQAEVHSGRAKYFAAGNVTAVLFTAGFAALAAVTSQTSVPTWVTTASAALSASIGIITASYSFQNKSWRQTGSVLGRATARWLNWGRPTNKARGWTPWTRC